MEEMYILKRCVLSSITVYLNGLYYHPGRGDDGQNDSITYLTLKFMPNLGFQFCFVMYFSGTKTFIINFLVYQVDALLNCLKTRADYVKNDDMLCGWNLWDYTAGFEEAA